jgi:hypothetical protein
LVIVDGLSERSLASGQAFDPQRQEFEIHRLRHERVNRHIQQDQRLTLHHESTPSQPSQPSQPNFSPPRLAKCRAKISRVRSAAEWDPLRTSPPGARRRQPGPNWQGIPSPRSPAAFARGSGSGLWSRSLESTCGEYRQLDSSGTKPAHPESRRGLKGKSGDCPAPASGTAHSAYSAYLL